MASYRHSHMDDVPPGSVVVRVWPMHGQTVADVAWTDCPLAEDIVVADFPRPVPLALERARKIMRFCGLDRVVVVLERGAEWQAAWGTLYEPARRQTGAENRAGR